MRKKESCVEFGRQRSECLLRNFRESIARQSIISRIKALEEAVAAPAPRFWVSEARATRVIRELLKGNDLTEGMLPEKRRMYKEILSRVKKAMNQHPEMPLGDIVFYIVNSPAPESYMQPDTAYKKLLEMNRPATDRSC